MITTGSRRAEVPRLASKYDYGGFNNLDGLTVSIRCRKGDNNNLLVNVVFSQFTALVAA